MFDVGWPELLLIGIVTLVAVGPKDLPKVMHTLGELAAKGRRAWLALEHHIDGIEVESERLNAATKDQKNVIEQSKRHEP